jgi:hypothetical protein
MNDSMSDETDVGGEAGELETVSDAIEEQESAAQTESVVDEVIPEKYRGKSIKELVDIAEHANKSMGRYANELGEVRRLADELIRSQIKPQEKEPARPEVDFFENPQEAIRQAVEANPKVLAAENYALQAQREMAKQKLAQLHPDSGVIVQDEKFVEWVNASPVRKRLFQEADNYNVDAANELFSTFKELKAARQGSGQAQVSDEEKASRAKTMTAAAVDTGGSGERSKKIYKRSDILRIMAFDKKKYEAMSDEISRAYREGRVK